MFIRRQGRTQLVFSPFYATLLSNGSPCTYDDVIGSSATFKADGEIKSAAASRLHVGCVQKPCSGCSYVHRVRKTIAIMMMTSCRVARKIKTPISRPKEISRTVSGENGRIPVRFPSTKNTKRVNDIRRQNFTEIRDERFAGQKTYATFWCNPEKYPRTHVTWVQSGHKNIG